MQQISISLRSFTRKNIEKSIEKIIEMADSVKVSQKHYFFYPISVKKYTLERSPHIDKKSREQFEMKKHKGQIVLFSSNPFKISLLLYLFKNSLFMGTEVSISVQFYDYFIEKKL